MYFALEKLSADYASVAKYGHVIDQTTFRYKLLFLLSSVVVSSRAEDQDGFLEQQSMNPVAQTQTNVLETQSGRPLLRA